MSAEVYSQSVLETTPIGCSLRKLQEKDKASLEVKFNIAYYLAKHERPFTDYPHLITLEKKNHLKNIGNSYVTNRACAVFTDYIGMVTKESFAEDFANTRYYSVLSDGSTDSAVIEQEVVYVLYLSKDGVPIVKYLSIESAENGDTDGLKDCISKAFERIGITKFSERLLGLNVDGANMNTGIHKGLSAKIKEEADWLQLVHCFNHRLELTLKDAFSRVAEAYGETIPKPTKAYGTRWIDHKLRATQIALDHYGPLIHHIESLSQTDSQPKQRAQLSGFLRGWKHASLPLSMSIYLDVLSPLRNMDLSFQKDCHDPVKAFRRVQDFTWNMAKLKLLIEGSLDSLNSIMATYKKFLRQIIEKESENDRKIRYFYQDVKLKKFQVRKTMLRKTTLRLFETSQPAWKSVFLIYMNHHYLNTWSVC